VHQQENLLVETAFIKIDNLSKIYGLFKKNRALDSVSLQIKKGEIFGLIGPNGAGKTTLMGCLLGLLKPSAGKVAIDGKSVHDLSVKAITGFIPERPNFDAWMSVKDFLHYHHMLANRPEADAKNDITTTISIVGLEPQVANRQIRKLSRGMLQRLGLAQLLIGKPQLCFLDEPTSGMDPLGMALVRDLLDGWRAQGTTVILNSHHLDQVERSCDRVAFIDKGKIGAIEELRSAHQTKQPFIVKWGQPYPAVDSIKRIAQENHVEVESCQEDSASFLLTNRSQSSPFLSSLLNAGILIEEALYEQKALVELFKKGRDKEQNK
jgi:ABC-2 type transport system ATP-binding protein